MPDRVLGLDFDEGFRFFIIRILKDNFFKLHVIQNVKALSKIKTYL